MTDGDEAFFKKDFNEPHHPGEMIVKFVSRQTAVQATSGSRIAPDADLCKELNQRAYEYALNVAGSAAQSRFNASGQELVFDDTSYASIGALFTAGSLVWEEVSGSMHVKSKGLFKEVTASNPLGLHYCKLLSPARAMEWIYVDGLKAKLFGVW